ncbi:MAG: SpoIVB peptidase S55 domain-containing protein [Candidatus Anammoxibacter sp.]
MKALIFIIILIVQLATSNLASLHAQDFLAGDDVMMIDDVKAGMKGYGKTVFSGTKIETFDVEILGVLKNYEAKRDMILVQLSGPVVERTGIISGMSGSPVYIDGKIIGALSYAWAFSKDPVAGVTPIADMLNVLDRDMQQENKEKKYIATVVNASIPKTISNSNFIPIKTPLMVSGFSSRVFEMMGSEFDILGMTPMQSGGVIDIDSADSETLVPGSAVAAQLIRGDLNASAIGTVTYRKGSHILAFGHPFLQMGDIDFAMSGAYVHTTLASLALSAKMASPTKILGKISQDRKAAIAGIIGEFARMIPCHIKLTTGTNEIIYDLEIVHNDLITANLCQMAFLSAILSTEKQSGEVFVRLGVEIFIEGIEKPVTLENIYYDSNSGVFPVSQIIQPIRELLNNRFKRIHIERIGFSAEFINELKIAFIDNIRIDKKVVSPGDTVNVTVKLKPYDRHKFIEKSINIQLPDNVSPGSKILVTACSSSYSNFLNMQRSSGKYKPANFQQLIELMNDVELNNELIIRVLLPGNGISYKGMEFPSLPASILAIMSRPNYSGTEMLFSEKIHRIKTDWLVNGNQSVLITVREE